MSDIWVMDGWGSCGYLIGTFFGGVVTAVLLGYLTQNFVVGVVGFFGYYIVKAIIKASVKKGVADNKARIKTDTESDAMVESNRKMKSALETAGKELSCVYDEVSIQGNNNNWTYKEMGPFIVPTGVNRITAIEYDRYNFSACQNGYQLELLVNGSTVKKDNILQALTLSLHYVNEGDIVTVRAWVYDGSIIGKFGVGFIKDKATISAHDLIDTEVKDDNAPAAVNSFTETVAPAEVKAPVEEKPFKANNDLLD